MSVTTTDLSPYLGLPPDSTEDLTGFLNSAKSKARTAGIPSFAHNAQYDEFIKALAAMYYDNRGMSAQSNDSDAMQRLVNAAVLELRYAEEDPEEPEEAADDTPEAGDPV
jgi:hypothetical protein